MGRRKRGREPAVPAGAWEVVHPLLDLHGLTADEARRAAERWLRARREERVGTVVVVTGRGRRSAGPPVLRGEIDDLLRRLRGSVVEEFAASRDGGAFRVELRPPPPPSRTRPAAPRVEPELRRRAEEALEELGVTPTPALVEAELRRMLRERGGA